jgi:acyl dehydratase
MIDKQWIGRELAMSELVIERGRLTFFAMATGETRQIYTEIEAARAAGFPDLPVPPTFLFAAELESGVTDRLLRDLKIPISKLLHGEQSFTYHAQIFAGDTVKVRSTISDIYDKKHGALEFIVKTSTVYNQRDEFVAELRSVLIVRH